MDVIIVPLEWLCLVSSGKGQRRSGIYCLGELLSGFCGRKPDIDYASPTLEVRRKLITGKVVHSKKFAYKSRMYKPK